ncbi:MAG: hypothetical protein ACXADA_10920 [Candidatus Hodarchaeales archaeon]
MNKKLIRLILLIAIIVISTYIGGIVIIGALAPSFLMNITFNSNLNDNEINNAFQQNNTMFRDSIINDGCCGHSDEIPPNITLISPTNTSTIFIETTIKLVITDEGETSGMEPYKVLFNWDNQDNTTLASPYDITDIPSENGTNLLHVYAVDDAGNWASEKYIFTITDDPSFTITSTTTTTSTTSTTTTTTNASAAGVLTVFSVLSFLSVIILFRKRRS